MLKKLCDEFPNVFDESDHLRPMKGEPMHIYLRNDVDIKPVHITAVRNIPYAYRDQTEEELLFMKKSEKIEPVV